MAIPRDVLWRIRDKEEEKLISLLPGQSKRVIIQTVEYLAENIPVTENVTEKVFRQTPLALYIPAFLFLILCWVFYRNPEGLSFYAIVILGLVGAGTGFYFLLVRYWRLLVINEQGIKVNRRFFRWEEILGIAVMYGPCDKRGADYLIVVMPDETYRKYRFPNPFLFNKKNEIAQYIIYFQTGK